jgi:hypothetical protein
MRVVSVLALTVFALAACGERKDVSAQAVNVDLTPPPAASDADPAVPTTVTAIDLRRICRAGLAAIHGQATDAISLDGVEGQVVNASWRAPVDGGRMRAQCRVDGDLVTWKPVDRPDPTQNRWMNQSGDPVVRFVIDGDRITITQTLPDGTTATEDYTVAAEQEAR